jgi:predicted DNA-binding protein
MEGDQRLILIPKVLISLRLDRELVEKLARRARELGVGVSVLIRRYIETMILYEELGLSRPVRLGVEEYGRLVKLVTDTGRIDEYISYLVEMFELITAWNFGNRETVSLYELLAKLMELLKSEGRITDYRAYSGGNRVGITFETISADAANLLNKALTRFLIKIGKNVTNVKTVGRTAYIEVKEVG